MNLLNKEYLEELVRLTILDTDFDLCEDMAEAVGKGEWEVDKVLACELAYLADADMDDPDARFYTMAERIREEYDIDVQEYVEEMYEENDYIRDRELARMGL